MRRDGHERIVHLVRDPRQQLARGREPALFLGAIAQYQGHLVEVLRQPADLVAAVHRDLHAEVAVGHPGEASIQILERPVDALAEQEQGDGEEDDREEQPQHGDDSGHG